MPMNHQTVPLPSASVPRRNGVRYSAPVHALALPETHQSVSNLKGVIGNEPSRSDSEQPTVLGLEQLLQAFAQVANDLASSSALAANARWFVAVLFGAPPRTPPYEEHVPEPGELTPVREHVRALDVPSVMPRAKEESVLLYVERVRRANNQLTLSPEEWARLTKISARELRRAVKHGGLPCKTIDAGRGHAGWVISVGDLLTYVNTVIAVQDGNEPPDWWQTVRPARRG